MAIYALSGDKVTSEFRSQRLFSGLSKIADAVIGGINVSKEQEERIPYLYKSFLIIFQYFILSHFLFCLSMMMWANRSAFSSLFTNPSSALLS